MSTRPVLGLIYMLQALKQLGEDPTPVLRRHGLVLEQLDPSTTIERGRELRIYADLAQNLRDPAIGLQMGQAYNLAGYGPLVMLLLTCANGYEAFQMGMRYQRLTYVYATLRFEPGEHYSALVLEPLLLAPKVFRFRVDGEVSGTYKMLRDLQTSLGLSLQAERIDMPYPRPPEAASYEAFFGCPVRFGEAVARLWLRNDYLHVRFPSADPVAHSLYRSMCDQQLRAQEVSLATLSEQVQSHLAMFTRSYPSVAEVARSFDLSERSLRRQLSEQGASFRDLLGRARYDKAQHLLCSTNQSVEAIAQELGYAESAAFIHAFQRWSGQTPAAFRGRA
ncbi:MAG: AraC family transcriptional regulator [Burkholderiales bacterium]|nr:AraC family transcriptional regulator [Burkholderiales bacterium]